MPHGRLGKPPWGVGRNGCESSDLGAVPVRPPHPGPTILACTVHVVRAVDSVPSSRRRRLSYLLGARRHHHQVWVSPRAREGCRVKRCSF